MISTSDIGRIGEDDVIKHVPCPNCGKSLLKLPPNHPLYDLQCSRCSFRAQVKTSNSKPKNVIFGAGWDVVEKVMKVGYLLPPLFVNYQWKDGRRVHRRIVFFPFIPRTHLVRHTLHSGRQAGYRMFNYVRLSELPHVTLFSR